MKHPPAEPLGDLWYGITFLKILKKLCLFLLFLKIERHGRNIFLCLSYECLQTEEKRKGISSPMG